MSKIMAMFTDQNEHIGFILFAGEIAPFGGNEWEGDCVFTGVPKEPQVFENPLCEYLQAKKNIEYLAKVTRTEKGFTVKIESSSGPFITAELTAEKKGFWLASGDSSIQLRGQCLVPEKTNP